MASSVTLNLILTCRKFVSLIISVVLFQHQFGIENWIGATLVFLGTALYSYPDKRVVAKKSD